MKRSVFRFAENASSVLCFTNIVKIPSGVCEVFYYLLLGQADTGFHVCMFPKHEEKN